MIDYTYIFSCYIVHQMNIIKVKSKDYCNRLFSEDKLRPFFKALNAVTKRRFSSTELSDFSSTAAVVCQ